MPLRDRSQQLCLFQKPSSLERRFSAALLKVRRFRTLPTDFCYSSYRLISQGHLILAWNIVTRQRVYRRLPKWKKCVLKGAQQANIDSKHTKRTGVCLDNITSECDTLGATGGLDDASKISDVRGIGEGKNDIADTLRVDKTGMNPSKASSTDDALFENPHGLTQATVVENAIDDVCSDAASTSSVYSKEVAAIDASKAANKENVEKCLNGAPLTLLCELQDPLNALIRCADIQRELFQSVMTLNELKTKEASDLSAKESSPRESKGEKPYSIE